LHAPRSAHAACAFPDGRWTKSVSAHPREVDLWRLGAPRILDGTTSQEHPTMNATQQTLRIGAFALSMAFSAAALAAAPPAAAPRDGSHDFDPLVGTWKAKLSRLEKPLTGSTKWIEFEGTQVTSRIWGGRGTMDEFHVDSPATGTKVDGLTVRLYNPESRQWSIYWANAKNGRFDGVPTVGRWENGRGEFYDQELYEGKMIFVRYVWSDV